MSNQGASPASPPFFLQGGSEMAALIAQFDWAGSPPSDMYTWPLFMQHTLSLMLHSHSPMFLYWGANAYSFTTMLTFPL